jgi:hypothetical protein
VHKGDKTTTTTTTTTMVMMIMMMMMMMMMIMMMMIIIMRETRKMKDGIAEKTKERWHGKRMHGQMPRSLYEKLVDKETIISLAKIWRH